VFDEPDSLRLDRRPNRHLAFAQGPHLCLGAALARMEGQVAFDALARRYPALPDLDADGHLEWRPNPAFRGVRELRI